ncbi:hypothetical protein NPS01_35250 [Nocardioides psychrotolerans]|uniref:Polyketide cyclase / dehydrase and lipid transport n=1 Tax=Nocardioides psychrotolerans TaxID=1005945 RepID=A0A1I3PTV4_9ACTN|nr:DUF2867 domain-containing protein [Nocardioides psychrotolerans]GEP39862.1 hypothetical protein NPS01_35250 [Nocardioides psychrotolerans]SFJ25234.1 Protein of unknown function [Nocardioides psychrotolerans]
MRRQSTLRTTTRESRLPVPAQQAWAVVASGRAGPQWYVDAAPFVVRGGIDRLVGGAGRAWPPPDTALLATGDRAGFWRVAEADLEQRHLVLVAEVRAPGTVTLLTDVLPDVEGCLVRQTVRLDPSGLLGAAYLLADLPAREAVLELTHRRLLHDLARDNRSGSWPVDQV